MTQKLNQNLIVSLALVLGFFFSSDSRACVASRSPRINYFLSYERPYAGLFADGASIQDIRPTIIDNCSSAVGQYLMISLALRTQKPTGRTADVSLINRLKDDSCQIKNSPFPVAQTYEDKSKNFEKQYALLRSCTYYDIVEIDDNELLLPETNPACKIEVLGKNHIRAEGDFCYLRVRANNRFAVGVGLKKECTRESTIRSLGLEPGDLQALLNTYLAGDTSGSTTDLTQVGSTVVRLALTSSSDLMPVSATQEPNNVPSWPTTFKANVEFGSLSIKTQRDARSQLDIMPLVDNFGTAKKCRAGICSNEFAFQAPIAGLVELSEYRNGRKKVVDSWYYGASAPSQYQGLLSSASKYLDPGLITIGKRYSIEMTMVNPYEDFLLFKSGLTQMMIDLSSLVTTAGLDVIQSFSSLGAVMGIKNINGLGSLSGPDAGQIIASALDELNDFKGPQHWPPYFDQMCINKGEACYTKGRVKFLKKIGAEFTVGEVREDQSYSLENVMIYSNDPVKGFQPRVNNQFPSVSCTNRMWD